MSIESFYYNDNELGCVDVDVVKKNVLKQKNT